MAGSQMRIWIPVILQHYLSLKLRSFPSANNRNFGMKCDTIEKRGACQQTFSIRKIVTAANILWAGVSEEFLPHYFRVSGWVLFFVRRPYAKSHISYVVRQMIERVPASHHFQVSDTDFSHASDATQSAALMTELVTGRRTLDARSIVLLSEEFDLCQCSERVVQLRKSLGCIICRRTRNAVHLLAQMR
jgi:hypothetical protein